MNQHYYSLLKKMYRFIKNYKIIPKYRLNNIYDYEFHGTEYGGWTILKDSLNRESVIFSFGIGNDISFDLSIIDKYECNVYGFDPTPGVKEWIHSKSFDSRFILTPIALSDSDGFLEFYSPENETYISHSIHKSIGSKKVVVPSKKIKSIMRDLEITEIDLLKMDIEGFEYQVLDNIFSENIFPKQLLIEFHYNFPEIGKTKTEKTINELQLFGYDLFHVSNNYREFSFTKR
jgi:FkbM family methyltransferase